MGLADDYEWQAGICAELGSPLYEHLLLRIAEELGDLTIYPGRDMYGL